LSLTFIVYIADFFRWWWMLGTGDVSLALPEARDEEEIAAARHRIGAHQIRVREFP